MGKTGGRCQESCPLEEVDRRLDDVRNHWIEASRQYNDPDSFRRNLNACITTLRSVTFLIQKNKKRISDFETWYGDKEDGHWRKKLREDPLMRWLQEARTHVEKKGDLKTCSTAHATLTSNWGFTFEQRMIVDPFMRTGEIAEYVREQLGFTGKVAEDFLLTIERRWIDSQLPETEILDALSYCYSCIAEIVSEAHHKIGIKGLCPYRKSIGVLDIEPQKIAHLRGRTPCMIATKGMRTVWVKMSTGEELRPILRTGHFDPEKAHEAVERYGLVESKENKEPRSIEEGVDYWFTAAKAMLSKDGYLIPTMICDGPNPIILHGEFNEQIDKMLFGDKAAELVETSGAKSIIFIGEVWIRIPEEWIHPKILKFTPREAIQVVYVSKDGNYKAISEEFERHEGSIVFGKRKVIQKIDSMTFHLLKPVLKTWGWNTEMGKDKIPPAKVSMQDLPWFQDGTSPCPCGSGRSYSKCCEKNIPPKNKLVRDYNKMDALDAEKAFRGALTKYIGNVMAHTIPILEKGGSFPLAEIDVRALIEIVETIVHYLDKQGKSEEVIRLFQHIRRTIDLPILSSKMLLMESVWYDVKYQDRDKAREALNDIDISYENDTELLQWCISIYKLNCTDKLKVIDRLLGQHPIPSVALNVLTQKALCYHMLGENEIALKILTEALDKYGIEPEHIPDVYYTDVCSKAYSMKWRLSGEEESFLKALKYYERLESAPFPAKGKAELYSELGSLYIYREDYDTAANYYLKSLNEEKSIVALIHLAESYIWGGKQPEAKEVLKSLEKIAIPEEVELEYLEVKALQALNLGDKLMAQTVFSKLKKLNLPEIYFEKQRDTICTKLLDLFSHR